MQSIQQWIGLGPANYCGKNGDAYGLVLTQVARILYTKRNANRGKGGRGGRGGGAGRGRGFRGGRRSWGGGRGGPREDGAGRGGRDPPAPGQKRPPPDQPGPGEGDNGAPSTSRGRRATTTDDQGYQTPAKVARIPSNPANPGMEYHEGVFWTKPAVAAIVNNEAQD